ncbi:MAG: glycosyltransferase family 2 protein [Nitriliruptor sp.]|nr:MAG: glycosyltransferase family 2 protein [Nitriliruptor sp.]
MARDWPSVSVVMPIRNEAEHLRQAVEAVLAQHYPGYLELVLAVAPSRDDSELIADRLAAEDPRVTVVPNPDGTTPSGLNRALEAASGDVIARVDAHAQLTSGYLATAVELLEVTGAANVGGVQRAVGTGPMQRAIARAMSSRFGTGDARFHYGGHAGPSDSVYLGVFRSEVLTTLGGFDERLLRNQDYELNVRIRNHGEIVWFDPRLEVIYHPRTSLSGVATQYWQYGRWKRVTLRQHPGSLRWRQLVPPAAVIANGVGVVAAMLTPWTLVVPGCYLAGLLFASAVAGRHDPAVLVRLPAVFATMHHAWGAGFLAGPPKAAS